MRSTEAKRAAKRLPGNVMLIVTPISDKCKAGKPLVIQVTVAADAPG